jgi:hypothetical protein
MFCAFPIYGGVYLCMVHMALHTKPPLAHAHCEVEQAKRSYSVNIGGGGSVSWVKGSTSKSMARGQNLAHKNGPHHKQMAKGNFKAVCADDPRHVHVRNVETSSNILIHGKR